jgi:hypothetical protein
VTVVAPVQNESASFGYLDKEQERLAQKAKPLGGTLKGEPRRRLRADGQR